MTRLLLVFIFLLSGISGLVYQVVWMRMLIRVFGVTTFAVSTVLTVFMAGLALGSLAAAKRMDRSSDLLKKYALVELLIGASAIISTLVIPVLPQALRAATRALEGNAMGIALVRAVLVTVALIVPTFLMGTTLPLISGYFAGRRRAAGKAVGVLYGINTLGAVVGVLLAGFVLLMTVGERATIYIAASLNAIVALLAFLVSKQGDEDADAEPESSPERAPISAESARRVMVVFAISGFAALGYEVIWSRVLGVILGHSVYGFSSMLANYLLGIALGSLVMSRFVSRIRRPIFVFCLLELAVAILSLISIHVFREAGLASVEPRHVFSQLWSFSDFYRLPLYSGLIVFPVTFALGAIFPVVTRIGTDADRSVVDAVGKLYGYNTVGCIVGSAVVGFVFVPALGTTMSFIVLSVLSAALGLVLFRLSAPVERAQRLTVGGSMLAFALLLSFSFQDPFFAIFMARGNGFPESKIIHEEDKAATVTLFLNKDQTRHLWINGYIVSSFPGHGSFMTHMPIALHPDPKRQLIIGMGVGESFKASMNDGLDTTVVELIPTVVEQFPVIHPADHQEYLPHPRAHIVQNDGRNFLVATEEKFDVILLDGTPPLYGPAMVSLTSSEFMQLVSEHLTEDGIYAYYLPFVCFEDDFWMVTRSFVEAFDHIGMWSDTRTSGAILLGTNSKKRLFEVDREAMARRVSERKLAQGEARFIDKTMEGLRFTEEQIRRKAAGYPMLTDDRPRTEFPLLKFWRGTQLQQDGQFVLRGLSAVE